MDDTTYKNNIVEDVRNTEEYGRIKRNLARIEERIADACLSCGRLPEDVTLIPAVKYTTKEQLGALLALGIPYVGENRVQHLQEHRLLWQGKDTAPIVHFIGSLQPNKAKYIWQDVSLIHSVDSDHLVKELKKQAILHQRSFDVLVEINIGREADKGGILPEDVADFCKLLSENYPHVNQKGFMTMAPKCQNSADYIKYFTQTRELSLDIWDKILHNNTYPYLSMGMSDSFEEAIRCGATIVRVGHALFE